MQANVHGRHILRHVFSGHRSLPNLRGAGSTPAHAARILGAEVAFDTTVRSKIPMPIIMSTDALAAATGAARRSGPSANGRMARASPTTNVTGPANAGLRHELVHGSVTNGHGKGRRRLTCVSV